MKIRSLVLLVSALTSVTSMAYAEDSSWSRNVALTSDYRYRGLSQTETDSALQGGADFTGSNGFYFGAWGSTISWLKGEDGEETSKLEVDVYGGMRVNLTDSITYDVGALTYFYPSNNQEVSPNTTEIYSQLSYGPAYIKYSHSVTNLFGVDDSKGSGYWDVGVNQELADTWVLNLHAGHQNIKNNGDISYSDYLLGVTKDFGSVAASVAAITTEASDTDEIHTKFVLTIKKTF